MTCGRSAGSRGEETTRASSVVEALPYKPQGVRIRRGEPVFRSRKLPWLRAFVPSYRETLRAPLRRHETPRLPPVKNAVSFLVHVSPGPGRRSAGRSTWICGRGKYFWTMARRYVRGGEDKCVSSIQFCGGISRNSSLGSCLKVRHVERFKDQNIEKTWRSGVQTWPIIHAALLVLGAYHVDGFLARSSS